MDMGTHMHTCEAVTLADIETKNYNIEKHDLFVLFL